MTILQFPIAQLEEAAELYAVEAEYWQRAFGATAELSPGDICVVLNIAWGVGLVALPKADLPAREELERLAFRQYVHERRHNARRPLGPERVEE